VSWDEITWGNQVMIFTIKKRINTELLIDLMASLCKVIKPMRVVSQWYLLIAGLSKPCAEVHIFISKVVRLKTSVNLS